MVGVMGHPRIGIRDAPLPLSRPTTTPASGAYSGGGIANAVLSVSPDASQEQKLTGKNLP